MKRNISIVLIMILLTVASLFLFSIIHLSIPTMDDFKTITTNSFDSNTMVVADELKLRKDYNINARDTEGFIYFAPKSTMDASQILIAKFNDEQVAMNAMKIIDNKTNNLEGQFRNYKPDQADILKNKYLKVQGKFLIFVSSNNVSNIKEQIQVLFK